MGDSSIPLSHTAISPDALIQSVGTPGFPIVFDVRRREAYDSDATVLPTAMWRDHRAARDWGELLVPNGRIVV